MAGYKGGRPRPGVNDERGVIDARDRMDRWGEGGGGGGWRRRKKEKEEAAAAAAGEGKVMEDTKMTRPRNETTSPLSPIPAKNNGVVRTPKVRVRPLLPVQASERARMATAKVAGKRPGFNATVKLAMSKLSERKTRR